MRSSLFTGDKHEKAMTFCRESNGLRGLIRATPLGSSIAGTLQESPAVLIEADISAAIMFTFAGMEVLPPGVLLCHTPYELDNCI
jgi:hypothetical protein